MKLHGVLLVDKPTGQTSHDLVARVRRILGTRAVGHAGTLDPMATGLMVLLVGEATKISDYLLNNDKTYEATIQLGIETDTLDIEGKILNQVDIELDPEFVAMQARSLKGEILLPVPQFSAVKRNGKKLLDYALNNEEVPEVNRLMNFHQVEVLEATAKSVKVKLACTKGTYIRAWSQKLGKDLGCGATLTALRRLESSPYNLEKAIPLERLSEIFSESISAEAAMEQMTESFIPIENCLMAWASFTVIGKDERLMSNGQIPRQLSQRMISEQKMANAQELSRGVRVFRGSSGQLLSILEIQPRKAPKVKRIFNFNS